MTRSRKGPVPEDPKARLTRSYAVNAETGCWEWTAYLDSNGYGRGFDGKRQDWAHRVVWRVHRGEIPQGLELDHLCCNTRCVNPDHLEPVTKAENVRRAVERRGLNDKHQRAAYLRAIGLTYAEIAEVMGYLGKEGAHGAVRAAIEKGLVDAADVPPSPKLTPDEVQEIRDLYEFGVPQSELARWYSRDSSQISRIISGERWSDLSERQRRRGEAA